MTWILILFIDNMVVQLNQPYETEAQCRYAGALLDAEQRTHSNFKELVWDCKRR